MKRTRSVKKAGLPRLFRHSTIALLGFMILAVATLSSPAFAASSDTIRFGAPTWPGVTVKTEVASQLVQALGYKTSTMSASPAFIVTGLKNDNLDVYFGGWMPIEKDLIIPASKKGEVKIVAKNISGAVMGLAVPGYVWDAGVHTVADLNKYADKFDHKIYGIEPGSGFNKKIDEAIKANRHDLGDWKLVPTSASVMLSQVKRAIQRKNWIVFLGWQPHWMNIVYDIKYLDAVGEHKIADTRSDVLTVINPKLVDRAPDVVKFLHQFVITTDEQSDWILQYSKKKRKASTIATEWIAGHMDRVGEWMNGVKTKDGKPAMEAIKAKFQS